MDNFKIIAIYIMRGFMSIFSVFPIKEKRYFFCSYDGKSISCNPLYFNRYLIKKNEEAEYIWAVNDIDNVFIPEDIRGKIKIVKTGSFHYFYYGYTSKYVIYNMGLYRGSFFKKRKEQYFINTWHGGGAYKKVSGQTNISRKERFVEALCGKQISYFLSSTKRFSEVMSVAESVPRECFLEIGMPRNDFLFNTENKEIFEKVYNYFKLEKSMNIALYAPTYRGEEKSAQGVMDLDIQQVKKALEKRFGGKWVILIRGHYFTKGLKERNAIDASLYNDMQELLYVSKVLITDYSSCIWDFSLMGKPGFLLTTDLEKYEKERSFYTPIADWQYPYAKSNDELIELIMTYNEKEAMEKIQRHFELLGTCECGKASALLYEQLHK